MTAATVVRAWSARMRVRKNVHGPIRLRHIMREGQIFPLAALVHL